MTNKIFIFSLIISAIMLMCACNKQSPDFFKNISRIDAVPDKEGFLPFRMYFSEDGTPTVRYVDRDSTLKDEIKLVYFRNENDNSNNSVIYFFTDEWGGIYQIRVKNDEIVKMRFVSKKLNRNISYTVIKMPKLYYGRQKTTITQKEIELLNLYQMEKYEDFNKELIGLIFTNDTTIDYPFKKLMDNDIISTVTSSDNMFKCYSFSGFKIYQFRTEGGEGMNGIIYDISAQCFTYNFGYGDDFNHYDTIFTVYIDNKKHYLVCYSISDYVDYEFNKIEAFFIDWSLEKAAIFKTDYSKEHLPEIEGAFYAENYGKFVYDDKNKLLYLPTQSTNPKNNYAVFQLKGKYFKQIRYEKDISVTN